MINPDELLVTGVFVEIVNREHDWKEQYQYVERHANEHTAVGADAPISN